jgi:hypothetical protein
MSVILRRKYLARIRRKEQEVAEWEGRLKDLALQVAEIEASIAEARILMSAWEEIVDDLPKALGAEQDATRKIRPNSNIDQVLKLLRKERRAMHIIEILTLMGLDPNKKNRSSITGTIGPYVRSGQVFTRPAPNTFGLLEWSEPDTEDSRPKHAEPSGLIRADEGFDLPADFGQKD